MTKRKAKTVTKTTRATRHEFGLLKIIQAEQAKKKLTPSATVDLAGRLHKTYKSAEKLYDPAKHAVYDLGAGIHRGKKFVAVVSPRSRDTVDIASVIKVLGQAWVDAHRNRSPYLEVHFYPNHR